MTTAHNIDLPAVLAERLTTTHPDVLRELLATFIHTLMGAEADALCGAGYGERSTEAHQLPQRVPAPPIRHPHRHIGSGDPKAAPGLLLPGLAAGTPQTRRAGTDHRGRHLLPARSLHPADGQARRNPGHHQSVEVSSQRDGQGTRHRGRGVPQPPARCRPVHVRRRGRPGAQGPRSRAGSSTCTR